MKRRLAASAAFFFIAAYYQHASAQQGAAPSPSPAAPAPQAPAQDRQAVLSKYCLTCHNENLKSGGLALSALDLASLSHDAYKWEKVVRKVRTGAMPPPGRPRPDKAAADNLVTWLETELDRAAL